MESKTETGSTLFLGVRSLDELDIGPRIAYGCQCSVFSVSLRGRAMDGMPLVLQVFPRSVYLESGLPSLIEPSQRLRSFPPVIPHVLRTLDFVLRDAPKEIVENLKFISFTPGIRLGVNTGTLECTAVLQERLPMTLCDFKSRAGRDEMPDAELEAVLAQVHRDIKSALEFVHAKGFVHTDVHDDNIMVRWEDGRLRGFLMDWGLCVRQSETYYQTIDDFRDLRYYM